MKKKQPRQPDRDDPPGLKPFALDVRGCRQLTEHYVQSTAALHSRSRGWIPAVKLDLHHKPLIGPGEEEVLELVIEPEAMEGLIKVLQTAMERARADAARGVVWP